MIVRADRQACIGSGACVDTAPEVFELDDEGLVHVLESEIDETLEAAVEDAVAMCPVEALALGQSPRAG
jgi:ferredoxin